MDQIARPRPKIAETVIEPTVRLREVTIGKCCELLGDTACLVCDVQLPGMSGPDLQARLIADGRRTPIVFVTGCFSETTRARVLTAGAVGYFAKPFDPRTLIGCLEGALASIPS